ncbi:MAG: 23S rRNA (adenine(1618)-N(6))-methyltransferase RlmF [Saprospiraceae bacterium]
MTKRILKSNLHPRNKHRYGYDFDKLIQASPQLLKYIILTPASRKSIDFSNDKSVKSLNAALLKSHYDIDYWHLPEGFLCPPIPSRVDYIHFVADLISRENRGQIIEGKSIRILDIGTGASCIYALLASKVYSWTVVASEYDQTALDSATHILLKNGLSQSISIIKQSDKSKILDNIIEKDDHYDVALCNPPFFSSEKEAQAANQRKWRNLKKLGKAMENRNFGGQSSELWYEGGELAFVEKYIDESKKYCQQVVWFTTLVSKEERIYPLMKLLRQARAEEIEINDMSQGQKKSRVLAWTFLNEKRRQKQYK